MGDLKRLSSQSAMTIVFNFRFDILRNFFHSNKMTRFNKVKGFLCIQINLKVLITFDKRGIPICACNGLLNAIFISWNLRPKCIHKLIHHSSFKISRISNCFCAWSCPNCLIMTLFDILSVKISSGMPHPSLVVIVSSE